MNETQPAASTGTPLVQRAISDERPFTLRIFADMSEISRRDTPESEPEKRDYVRGAITGFSRKARTRMFRFLAKIQNPGELYFLTVTYPDRAWFGPARDGLSLQADLENLCKRIEYQSPNAAIIWRKEVVTRKSGEHVGEPAPHIHLIVKNFAHEDKDAAHDWLQDAWSEIIGLEPGTKKARVDAQIARSRKHAYHYLSKYVAKVTDSGAEGEIISEFFHNQAGKFGRHWGYRGEWCTESMVEFNLEASEVKQLKRLIRRWLKSRGKKRIARNFARVHPENGLSVLGLGAESEQLFPLIVQMVRHVRQLE